MVVDVCQPWHYKKIMKPVLETILDELGKPAPDIVVATDYDSDHIGGLIPVDKVHHLYHGYELEDWPEI